MLRVGVFSKMTKEETNQEIKKWCEEAIAQLDKDIEFLKGQRYGYKVLMNGFGITNKNIIKE